MHTQNRLKLTATTAIAEKPSKEHCDLTRQPPRRHKNARNRLRSSPSSLEKPSPPPSARSIHGHTPLPPAAGVYAKQTSDAWPIARPNLERRSALSLIRWQAGAPRPPPPSPAAEKRKIRPSPLTNFTHPPWSAAVKQSTLRSPRLASPAPYLPVSTTSPRRQDREKSGGRRGTPRPWYGRA